MLSLHKIIFAILLAIPIFLFGGVVGPVVYAAETAPNAPVAPSNLTELEALSSGNPEGDLKVIGCAGVSGATDLTCWVPIIAYYAAYTPAMLLLTMSGYIFDYTLSLSIDKVFIDQSFVNKTWTVVRDFSNMIFIFILLYTGIQTMLGVGNWGKTIINIVIIALLINFSMFFSKVIIDAGNILAVGVYEGMGVVKDDIDRSHKPKTKDGDKLIEERNISATLVNAFAPQKFTALAANADKAFVTTIFLIAAIVSFYVAFIFIKASLMFVGRLIAFWFFMIISPFALISIVLPKGNIFDFWLNGLISQAFVAPVFLFFVYIIMVAVGTDGGILNGYESSSGSGFFFDSIIIPVVVTGMITYALQKALGVAKSMSGSFGDIGANAVSKILSSFPIGMGANLALGGGASILRKTVGQGASKFLGSKRLEGLVGSGSSFTRMFGRGLEHTAGWAEKSSFDVRNTSLSKKGLGAIKSGLGVDVNLGAAGGKGGWAKEEKIRDKEDQARAKKREVSAQEIAKKAAEMDSEYAKARDRREEQYQTAREARLQEPAARARAESTPEHKEMKVAENKATQMGSTSKMEGDRLAKKIESLKKQEAAAIVVGSKEVIQEEVAREEEALRDLENAVQRAENLKAEAQKKYKETKEYTQLKEVEDAVNMSNEILKNTDTLIKKTEEGLAEWKNAENERRREVSAVDSNALRVFYDKDTKEERKKTFRADKSKDVREKEKKDKEFSKKLLKAVEKEESEQAEKKEEKEKEEGEKK